VTAAPLTYWEPHGEHLVNRATGGQVTSRHKGLLQVLPEDAMPARPRGDAKERTFNLLIRDGIEPRASHPEVQLIGKRAGDDQRAFSADPAIAADFRHVFGEILDDHYVIEAKGGVRFLFPFQSSLPGAYEFHGRYKMFNGKILAFLCQPTSESAGFNAQLIEDFYGLFNGTDGLTLLDTSVLDLARASAGDGAEYAAQASVLLKRHYEDLPSGPGALIPAAHQRFQRDLATVLSVKRLNRKDQVNYAVNVFYLHLALYFQRLGWLLEEEFSRALEAIADPAITLDAARRCFSSGWETSPFAGSVQFRVGAGHSKPVSMTDGAVTSYSAQNRRQLLMPANLSALGAAREVMAACGQQSGKWTFADTARACRDDPGLGAAFDEAMGAIAIATVAGQPAHDLHDIQSQVAGGAAGLEVFREALLKISRSALRRHGRDIIHGLVHRGGRGYITSRGRGLFFFEIGQDLLLLLAKMIVGDAPMPFRQFLRELRAYGFEPQSREEHERLADTLRALNLLEKHSDAGEAMYVKHFL
jgi:hypothetical protein